MESSQIFSFFEEKLICCTCAWTFNIHVKKIVITTHFNKMFLLLINIIIYIDGMSERKQFLYVLRKFNYILENDISYSNVCNLKKPGKIPTDWRYFITNFTRGHYSIDLFQSHYYSLFCLKIWKWYLINHYYELWGNFRVSNYFNSKVSVWFVSIIHVIKLKPVKVHLYKIFCSESILLL